MTAGSPWSVKGIDPKAREIAKDLARRSGMTLGEWLNQVILEDGPVEEPAPYTAFGHDTQAPYAQPTYRRFETSDHPGDELSRVTQALERLSARIEAAEHRSTLAISGVDQSVAGLVSRLTANEREQTAVAARFEGLGDDIKVEQNRLTERLRRIEQDAAGPRSAEALHTMEQALGKVAGHLYEGEARTSQELMALRQGLATVTERVENGPAGVGATELVDTVVARVAERLEQAGARTNDAIRGLEVSFAHLDERLRTAEAQNDAQNQARGGDAGLERLTANLSARVDAARAEMAEKIRASADGRYDRMERTLAEMNGHVQAAERRSAQAIERMGHEVLRMAETLSRKVDDVEHRSAGAISQVSGEVGRIATAMESRLSNIDTAGAQALEKLGGEIARITERLAERITSAERRSAQAIDDVGDQMSRVAERMQERQDRVSSELSDRIRQSEDRTAKLLDEAREKIDQRLGESHRKLVETVAAPAQAYVEPGVAPFGAGGYSTAPLPDHSTDAGRFGHSAIADADFSPRGLVVQPAPDLAHDDDQDLLTPRGFTDDEFGEPAPFGQLAPYAKPAPHDEVSPFGLAHEDEDDGFIKPEQAPQAPYSAQGSYAAEPRYSAEAAYSPAAYAEPDASHEEADEALFVQPGSTRDLIAKARAAANASSQEASKSNVADRAASLFSGFSLGKKKAKGGSSMRTLLLLSGVAAAAGVSIAGYVLMNDKGSGAVPDRVAAGQTQSGPLSDGEMARPLAAVALSPTPIAGSALGANPAAATDGPALYEDGARRIEAHDFTGVDALHKAANLGYGPAQFYLAKLYEEGQAGLRKDPAEARVWTERAANSGDRKAMHNLALYYFEGTGGPKNMTTAAQWFRKAADLGLVDSQYNLARLYEKGFGVAQNPAEAYKWYLIAARSGDADSRGSAQALKGQLSAESQAAAERAAASFRAQGPDAGAVNAGLNPAPQVAQATGGLNETAQLQKALSRLGYYEGPTDGVSSPALRGAIAAYQRDQGLPKTGQLDPSSEQLLLAAAQ